MQKPRLKSLQHAPTEYQIRAFIAEEMGQNTMEVFLTPMLLEEAPLTWEQRNAHGGNQAFAVTIFTRTLLGIKTLEGDVIVTDYGDEEYEITLKCGWTYVTREFVAPLKQAHIHYTLEQLQSMMSPFKLMHHGPVPAGYETIYAPQDH